MAKFDVCSLLIIFILWASFIHGINQEAISKEPRYNTWPKLGQGTYGDVRQFGDRAVKIGVIKDEAQCSRNILEAAIYRAFKHPSVPEIFNIAIHKGKYDNFLEIYMPVFKPVKEGNFSDALQQVAAVLCCAHANNIANRDVKKHHMMRSGTSIVLIDWGMADIFAAAPIDRRGTTLGYCSPEVLLANFTNPKENDMWAFGISLIELANGIERLFSHSDAHLVLNSIFANSINSITTLKSLVDCYKNGNQKLSDTLLKPLEKITCPLQKQDVICMLQPFSADRISAKQLLKNASSTSQSNAIASLPQPIFRKHCQINSRMREITYLWFYELMLEFQHPSKVLFEAMSITDRFITTTDLTKKNLQLAAVIAYYLAEDFYDDGHTIDVFIHYTDHTFTKEEFNALMLTLLENAQFNLIFNHSLRAYQQQIYQGDMSHSDRGMALLLLTMLEISPKTYTMSNLEKWHVVQAVLGHLSNGASVSVEHRSVWQEICSYFSDSKLAQRPFYREICKHVQ